MRISHRYREAFKEHFNMVGLATTAALSAAALSPVPILLGLVMEAAYLLFVPDSKWYDARLSARYDAEVERRRQQLKEQILPTLPSDMQACFRRLEETRRQMSAQPIEGKAWFREVLRKLDYLLEKFLMFASKETQFRAYLRSVLAEVHNDKPRNNWRSPSEDTSRPPGARRPRGAPASTPPPVSQSPDLPPGGEQERAPIDRWVQQTVNEVQMRYDLEMRDLKALLEKEQDVNTKAVLEKRLDVLQRRHGFVDKIGRILINLDHQLALLEDTFGLITDEIRARSPEQILADIDDVVGQTDTMTQVLEEVAPYEQLVARMEQTRV